MSAKLMGEVWALELDHARQAVMLALADHGHDDGSSIHPSVDYLAWKTGYERRQVQRILKRLVKDELLEPVGDTTGGRGLANEYQMRLEKGVKKTPWKDVKRATKCHPLGEKKGDISDVKRVTFEAERVTFQPQKGDIAMSSQPSENHQEPKTLSLAPARSPEEKTRERVGSKFSLKKILAYVAHLQTNGHQVRSPNGLAMKLYNSGESDPLIEAWLEPKPPPDLSGCPDCAGSGHYYPDGYAKGVRRCTHEKMRA